MMRTAAALLFLCALAVGFACRTSAQTEHITLTIEAADGALLVRGPQPAVTEARAAVDAAATPDWTVEQARALIMEKFAGRGLDVIAFAEATAAGGKGVSRVETSVRRALLLGLLPPVEELPADTAAAVLNAAGLRAMERPAWDALSGGGQFAEAARGAQPLVILSGTNPHDAVIIIYLEPGGGAGESETP